MIELTGNSLNKRHQELNTKVNEAARSNLNFEEIKEASEKSDVDKLFKIDLASKYKIIDYMLEVLKSGESLYISRALKCDWIIDDEYSKFINPSYLERNIFPFMSRKMKHKLLSTVSSRLRNGERAEEFHHYCMRNRMNKLGMAFLLYTNESFKIEILTLHPHVYNDFDRNENYVEQFIGNSFLLAEHYLKVVSHFARSSVLHKLRYLYSVSEEQYLDLLEAFGAGHNTSLKMSRKIMKKYKKRVHKDPLFYLSILNQQVVTQYSSSDDAKVYAIAFLPDDSYGFWNSYSYSNTETHFFLHLVPCDERLSFLRKIFSEKYPAKMFEMDYRFYTLKYYEMMTVTEKEDWALRHIASGKELHGCGNDYIWYQFVNFEKAFVELKKYIVINPNNDKRSNILGILVNSAKTQEEVTILLDYYYKRHVNEMRDYKRIFLDQIISSHKVLHFNHECWSALEKIFYSLDVYSDLSEDNNDWQNNQYRVLSLKYYIIHEKPVPEVFYEFVIMAVITVQNMGCTYDYDLEPKVLDKIFQYMLRCYTNYVEWIIQEKSKEVILDNIFPILELIIAFAKTVEDIPKSIYEQILLNFKMFENHILFAKITDEKPPPSPPPPPPEFHIRDIMHYLKEDASLVVSEFFTIKKYFDTSLHRGPKTNINWLIRKLNIYFSHDIAPEYIKLLDECLSVEKLHLHTARVAVFGIFNLSKEKYKIDFLKKYVPDDAKIDHVKISRNHLTVQTAICSIACHARPPLPLSSFRDYIKGDYLQYCIPIFNSYLANLTPDQCLSFVESLIDSPVSIQKHSLRLAFHCFSTENLKVTILKAWKKTKNASIRNLIYKTLYNKIHYYYDSSITQWNLFGVLTILTHDLNHDDDDGIFVLLTANLPPNIFGDHLQSAFTVISTFPKKYEYYQRLAAITAAMEQNVTLIAKPFLLAMMEDHIDTMLDHKLILDRNLQDGQYEVIGAKWSLIKTVIMIQKDIHILRLVMNKCLDKWYETDGDSTEYVYRKFWTEFLYDLETISYEGDADHFLDTNHIFRAVLTDMKNAVPFKEVYSLIWNLRVNILTRQVLGENVSSIYKTEQDTANILVKETILKFCRLIGSLIKEYIEENKFFPTFYNAIQEIINKAIEKVYSNLSHFIVDGVNATDVNVLLCAVLLEDSAREMHIFLLNFLPRYYRNNDTFRTEYIDVIKKLKSLDDEEIQYFMCNQFYSSDYQYRDFMP